MRRYTQPESLATLQVIRSTIGEYNFQSQYQQSPTPLSGMMVKAEWLRNYDPGDLSPQFSRIVQSWDTANKATELSDSASAPPGACTIGASIFWT